MKSPVLKNKRSLTPGWALGLISDQAFFRGPISPRVQPK